MPTNGRRTKFPRKLDQIDPVGLYDRVRHCFGARQHQQHPASNRKGRGVWAANCDPAKDVTAFAKVHQVIRGGKLIYPASLATFRRKNAVSEAALVRCGGNGIVFAIQFRPAQIDQA